jgi:hypothetical protein
LDVFLKLRPRKYKYNAYTIISADVLSRSNNLIEYEGVFAAIALSLSSQHPALTSTVEYVSKEIYKRDIAEHASYSE